MGGVTGGASRMADVVFLASAPRRGGMSRSRTRPVMMLLCLFGIMAGGASASTSANTQRPRPTYMTDKMFIENQISELHRRANVSCFPIAQCLLWTCCALLQHGLGIERNTVVCSVRVLTSRRAPLNYRRRFWPTPSSLTAVDVSVIPTELL